MRPAVVADSLGECHARFPSVPIVFCETRALAQEWTYRFLAAALVHHGEESHVATEASELPSAAPASSAEIRAWARAEGLTVSTRGRISAEVLGAFARRSR